MATLCPEAFSQRAESANVVVTGASGFVGSKFCQDFVKAKTAGRKSTDNYYLQLPEQIPDLSGATHVVHLASIAHAKANESEYDRVIVQGSVELYKAAIKAKVKTFVYISSIKAMGEEADFAYKNDSQCNPLCKYGRAKLAAEVSLNNLAKNSNTKLIIIRPPLIWGQQPKGNLLLLSKAIKLGIPLPFKNVENSRSLCHINNLISFMYFALFDEQLESGVYIVADPISVSTGQIINNLAEQLKIKARLWPCWTWIFKLVFTAIGRAHLYNRLFGSLTVDLDYTYKMCAWRARMYKFN